MEHALHRLVKGALSAHGKVMLIAGAVHVNGEGQILAWLEPARIELFFEQDGVRAEVDVLAPLHEGLDEGLNVRPHEGLAPWNRDHGGAARIDGPEGIFQ